LIELFITNLRLKFLYYYKKKINSYKNLKIAFVKQDVGDNLYCCHSTTDPEELLISSLKHSGPLGLFTTFDVDFHIVKTEEDEECNIWKQKWYDCQHCSIETYESFKYKIYKNGERGHTKPQGDFSVSCYNINWEKYDIVITLDIAIPNKITKALKNTIWSYFISEPCMRSYNESKLKVIEGYDLFLNQKMGFIKLNPFKLNKFTEIDFPLDLQYYGCFHDILNINKSNQKNGFFIESHTYNDLSSAQKNKLEEFGPIRSVSPKSVDIIKDLIMSKYFIRFGGRTMWGNSMIEAVACGCLSIGNPDEFVNKSLFSKDISIKTFDELIDKIAFFENNQKMFEKILVKQRHLLDYFCFYKPLIEFIKKSKKIIKFKNK